MFNITESIPTVPPWVPWVPCRTLSRGQHSALPSALQFTFPTASLDKNCVCDTPPWHAPKLLLSNCLLLPYPCFYYPLPQFHSVAHQLNPPVVSTFLNVSFTFVQRYKHAPPPVIWHLLSSQESVEKVH